MQYHIDDIMQIELNEQQVFSTMETLVRQKYSKRWEIKLNKIQNFATLLEYFRDPVHTCYTLDAMLYIRDPLVRAC